MNELRVEMDLMCKDSAAFMLPSITCNIYVYD